MPKDHIIQWHHNRAFLGTIDPDFPDWAVTVTFYTALHAVDALLKSDGVSISSHVQRNEALFKTNRYQFIVRQYQPLYGLSRTIRYFAKPTKWVPWEKIEAEVFRRYLYPIEKSVQKLMGNLEALPPIQMRIADSTS